MEQATCSKHVILYPFESVQRYQFMKSKWPTLKGRLNQPLTTRKEALLQLKNSGMELTPKAQKELDRLLKKDRKPV